LASMLTELPPRIDTPLLFATGQGRPWWPSNFYRSIWRPARTAAVKLVTDARADDPAAHAGVRPAPLAGVRPHDCRHSFVSQLRALGIDDADLAEAAGHTVETMVSRYTHPLGRSHSKIREAIG